VAPCYQEISKREKITISDFVARYRDDPVQFLDAPRPDFNGALIQFLIGLIQTTYSPSSDREWRKKFRDPPSPDELTTVFNRYNHAFNLDGDSPRFMQDFYTL
jgi:CRISPR system Cascade subunit CasA